MTTSLPTTYRSYFQTVLRLRPATITRHPVSLMRYFPWAADRRLVVRDPAKTVKLVPRVVQRPRHHTDSEDNALLGAVTRHGSLRDRTLLALALHTGLRPQELCKLRPEHIRLGRRSGGLKVYGKRNRHSAVPLNSALREALSESLSKVPSGSPWLFASQKKGKDDQRVPITERTLGYVGTRHARLAILEGVSPHDLRHRFGYPCPRVCRSIGSF